MQTTNMFVPSQKELLLFCSSIVRNVFVCKYCKAYVT